MCFHAMGHTKFNMVYYTVCNTQGVAYIVVLQYIVGSQRHK